MTCPKSPTRCFAVSPVQDGQPIRVGRDSLAAQAIERAHAQCVAGVVERGDRLTHMEAGTQGAVVALADPGWGRGQALPDQRFREDR